MIDLIIGLMSIYLIYLSDDFSRKFGNTQLSRANKKLDNNFKWLIRFFYAGATTELAIATVNDRFLPKMQKKPHCFFIYQWHRCGAIFHGLNAERAMRS